MDAMKGSYFIAAIALILYLFCSLTFLELPGLQYDEVNFISVSMGGGNDQFIAYRPKLFGKRTPLMVMNYIGAVKSYLYVPVFKLDTSASAVRLPVIVIGLITLLISYAAFRRMFDHRIAATGLLLFAADPSFIFGNKLDWGPVSLMLVLEVAALYFMWRWLMEGKRWFLGMAGFLLGLGLYNKVIFAWYIAALLAGLFLLYRRKFREILTRRNLVCFIPALMLGCLPLIAFNIDIPWRTFQYRQGLAPLNAETFNQRTALIRGTLDGGGVYHLVNKDEVGNPSGILGNPGTDSIDRAIRKVAAFSWVKKSPLPLILGLSIVFLALLWALGKLRMKREILFIVAQLAVMLLCIGVTGEATGAHHVIPLCPLIFAIIAYAVCELGHWLSRSNLMEAFLICLCLLPLTVSQVVLDARYLRSFQTRGGVGTWSDAIYTLASYANRNPDKRFVLMEWGLTNQLILLSDGRIRQQEFSCPDRSNLEACIEPLIKENGSLFVFFAPPFGDAPVLDTFKRVASKQGLSGLLKETFYQRDGRPVYLVYEGARTAGLPN